MKKWYSRLADVPGIEYSGSPEVDRASLPEHDAKPELRIQILEGKRSESLWWESTTASPAARWQTTPLPSETTAQTIVRRCHEALELPGTLTDYHFIIQRAHEELWKHRHHEPWTVAETERLCWLHVRLVRACGGAIISPENNEGVEHPPVVAFQRLVEMYEQDGYLREALVVARLAIRFNQSHLQQPRPPHLRRGPRATLERLEKKIKALEAEDDA